MGAKGPKLGNKKSNVGLGSPAGETVTVREFEPADEPEVMRIFHQGLMEMIPNIAFRGLTHHPESLLLYAAITVVSLALTMCWWVILLLPALVVGARFFYCRRVIHGYLAKAMSGDMGDIEGYYMKSPGSCLWVAVLSQKVIGVVAADGRQDEEGRAVELRRMCVDRRYRRCGVGMALGKRLLEFAAASGYSSVKLGTTAYTPAAHQLYRRLGFQCVGVTNGYATPGSTQSLPERLFYRVRCHHYTYKVSNVT